MKTSKAKPQLIDLPERRLDEIKNRLSMGVPLPDEDKKIVLTIISTYSWLQYQLQSAKLTMQRLKKIFGFSSEKHKNVKLNNSGLGSDFLKEGISAEQALSLDELQGITKGPPEKK